MTNREILGDLAEAAEALRAAQEAVRKAHQAVIHRDTLPAPVMDEDAIVAALKRDPALAGAVLCGLAIAVNSGERSRIGDEARTRAAEYSDMGARCIQSLAVALAAASYRGA